MNHLFIEFTIRATLIVACTGIVLWAAQIRNAAARHKAWRNVMLLMLLLPLWIALGPRAHVPVPSILPPSVSAVIRLPKGSSETAAVASSVQIGPGRYRGDASTCGKRNSRQSLDDAKLREPTVCLTVRGAKMGGNLETEQGEVELRPGSRNSGDAEFH